MKQVNVFHKGMIMDIDPSLIPQDSWTYPSTGVRIVNLEGKGFVCQNIDGTNELFSLGENMVPIGSVEFNSILYIFSAKIDEPGVLEVGSYPSPISWSVNTSGLENTYKPLKNFEVNGVRENFRTSLFNGSVLNRIEVIARESYDNSVDLYFCDNVNPLRTINSGFRQDGAINERTVKAEQFSSSVNVIQSTSYKPIFEFGSIEDGGSLLNGNYFIFARYTTDDFNSTEFLANSFAYAVYYDIQQYGKTEGGKSLENSSKKIKFRLTNIDTSYKYVEFSVIRYYGDNAPIQYESLLYNNLIPITGEEQEFEIADGDRLVPFPIEEILKPRNRDTIPKSITYLDNTLWGANWKEKDRYNKVLEEYAKRVMIYPDVNSIEDYAYDSVVRTLPFFGQLEKKYYRPNDVYDNPQYVHDFVGYFRGETYAIALVYDFNDGDITDAYPTAGRDDYANSTCYVNLSYEDYQDSTKFNTNGFYRTPSADLICDDEDDKYQLLKPGDRRLMCLKLDFSEANNWINTEANEKDKKWFVDNIKKINIARAERKENLITQGIAMNLVVPEGTINTILGDCSYGHPPLNTSTEITTTELVQSNIDMQTEWGDGDFDYTEIDNTFGRIVMGNNFSTQIDEALRWRYPFFRGYIPMWAQNRKTGIGSFNRTISYTVRGAMMKNEYGVFSTDYIFNKTLNVQDARYIKRVGSTIVDNTDVKIIGEGYWSDVFPDQPLQMMTELLSVPKTTSTLKTKVVPVSEFDTPTEAGGFNSKCVGSAHDLNNEVNMYYYRKNIGNPSETISNRKFVSLPWLSFEIENVNGDITSIITNEEIDEVIEKPSCYNLDIVNLTKENPETLDILTWYDKQFLKYKIASRGIDINVVNEDVTTIETIYLWNGDCFLQRTALRVLGWNPTNAITGQDGLKIVGESIGSENSEQYGWDWAEQMTNSSHVRYAHGLVLSIVTENKYNTNYRFRNRFGLNDYFENKLNDLNWIISCWKETTRESVLLNTGNSKILPDKEVSIYPYFSPYNGVKHPTRIRFSNKYSPGSFLDANRQFESLHYKDFDYAFGEIISIKNNNGMLLSIQESIINRHYVNEKALQVDAENQSLILGSNSQYLTEQTYTVGEFGSKHQNSIYKTENGIYGVDFDRNIIWKTGYVEGGIALIYKAADLSLNKSCRSWIERIYKEFNPTGNPLMKLKDTPANGEGILVGYDRLNKEVLFTFLVWIEGSINDYDRIFYIPRNENSHINILYPKRIVATYNGLIYSSKIQDNHYLQNNTDTWDLLNNPFSFVSGSYNDGEWVVGNIGSVYYIVCVKAKISPIYATTISDLFVHEDVVVGGGNKTLRVYNYVAIDVVYKKKNFKTLIFSEKNDAFTSEFPCTPIWYGLLDNNFYSVKEKEKVHIHNQSNKIQSFYGEIKPFIITFVVQGNTGESSASIFMKYFTSLEIEINHVRLKEIRYKTELQEGLYVYSENSEEFWKDAEYFENKLRVPVYIQTSPPTDWEDGTIEYYDESDIKGTYVIISLVYNPEDEAQKIVLRNAITNFNISQS